MTRTSTDRVSGLVVELKFLGLFLVSKFAWWSGLVVDVKEQRPQNIMLLKWAHTHTAMVSGLMVEFKFPALILLENITW